MTSKKTDRGFKIYGKFADVYLSDVRVQESSLATKRCCWIFVENDGKKPGSNLVTEGAIHLSPAKAKQLIRALERFISDD